MELCHLKVSNIDGQRHLLRVTQGKGAKDRAVILTETLLQHLRAYWQQSRPVDWLFPSSLLPDRAIHPTSIQKGIFLIDDALEANSIYDQC